MSLEWIRTCESHPKSFAEYFWTHTGPANENKLHQVSDPQKGPWTSINFKLFLK